MKLPNLPEHWSWSTFGHQLIRRDAKLDPQTCPDEKFNYIGLEDIESHTGRLIKKPSELTEGQEIKSIKSIFQHGDILYGKLRPALNKIWLSTQSGVCTTDCWVLTTRETTMPEYAAYYLRSNHVLRYTERIATGANLPRVSAASFDRIPIPLPPLPEQQRIVAILSEADNLRRQKQETIEQSQELASNLFRSLFGDPNPRRNTRWPTAKLGDKVTVETGGTPSRHADGLYGGEINWVKSTELIDSEIEETEEKLTEKGLASSNTKLFPPNTILLAMYGQGQTRGRTAKLLKPASCNQACAALLPGGNIIPDYLWFWLQNSYEDVRAFGRGGQQANLNLSIVRGLVLPVPPVHLQKKFSGAVREIRNFVADLYTNKAEFEKLRLCLVSAAFSGKLTETWRAYHHRELEAAARERDQKLAGQPRITLTEHASEGRRISSLLERNWLKSQWSEVQQSVWDALIHQRRGSLTPSEEGALTEFRQQCFQIEHLENADDSILRALEQLAGMGLIAKVSVRNEEGEYVTAYRPLRDEERSRGDDIAVLSDTVG